MKQQKWIPPLAEENNNVSDESCFRSQAAADASPRAAADVAADASVF